VGLGLGVATAGIAGYLWYKEMREKKRARTAHTGKGTLIVAPAIAPTFTGAAATWQF
jgi:hypothetical protein